MPEENVTENPETNIDTAEAPAPETAPEPEKASDEPQSDVGSGIIAAPVDIDVKQESKPAELEPTPVNESLTLEQQIEAWRDQANDVCIIINQRQGHQQQFERLLNKIVKKINQLNEVYAKENATDGYQILIERKPSGVLIIEAGSSHEAYGFRDDLDAKLVDYIENDQDSLIEVTSSKSEFTKTAKILVSSIQGYSVQTFKDYKDYVSPRKLLPLDELVLRAPLPSTNAGNNRILVR